MNLFDAAIYLFGLFAIVTGFNAGLLRSLATILAYAAAAPIAIAFSPRVSAMLVERGLMTPDKTTYVAFVLLLAVGFVLGVFFRAGVGGMTGGHTVFIDRVLGAALGAVRVLLLGVLLVVIFERIIPAGQEPAWLLESKLRPTLSAAGAAGLRALPPDTAAYIDRLKKERGL
ncbi:MAG: CvpA family protein [Pseudolabrys sp.]|nr:CvpA family protein [Pseudolabrys sp.]